MHLISGCFQWTTFVPCLLTGGGTATLYWVREPGILSVLPLCLQSICVLVLFTSVLYVHVMSFFIPIQKQGYLDNPSIKIKGYSEGYVHLIDRQINDTTQYSLITLNTTYVSKL